MNYKYTDVGLCRKKTKSKKESLELLQQNMNSICKQNIWKWITFQKIGNGLWGVET